MAWGQVSFPRGVSSCDHCRAREFWPGWAALAPRRKRNATGGKRRMGDSFPDGTDERQAMQLGNSGPILSAVDDVDCVSPAIRSKQYGSLPGPHAHRSVANGGLTVIGWTKESLIEGYAG